MALTLTLPLESFERKLLEEYISLFSPTTSNHQLKDHDFEDLFYDWQWAREVLDQFNDVFFGEYFDEDYNGDRRYAWEKYVNSLQGDNSQYRFYRVEALLTSNEHVPNEVYTMDAETVVKAAPATADLTLWEVISSLQVDSLSGVKDSANASIFDLYPGLLVKDEREEEDQNEHIDGGESDLQEGDQEEEDSFSEEPYTPRFSIWSLLRTCSIYHRRNNNKERVEEFLADSGFHTHFAKIRGEAYVHCSRLNGDFEAFSTFDNPAKYVEYIDWEELEHVQIRELTESSLSGRFARWYASTQARLDHHIYTEEEVYRFCVEHTFTFPDHLDQGLVLFTLTPLKDTRFITDMPNFWERWNDCGVTQDPNTKEWLLLETLPGRRFRQIQRSHGDLAGVKYFRGVIDNVRDETAENLQDALGLDFKPEYLNLLQLIPFHQITSIDHQPIGRGAHGIVFRGVWDCPQKTGMQGPETRSIALKTVHGLVGPHQKAGFIKELDVTFAALSGAGSGSISFYGITKAPPMGDPMYAIRPDLENIPKDSLFLVFEYLREGSLSTYLKSKLKGENLDWKVIFDVVVEVAGGLAALHKLSIVHRDLHWENVLVTYRRTPSDPLADEVISIEISDLGEGKMMNQSTTSMGGASYGNNDFRAPEVRNYSDHTPESDVYAFGKLTSEMVAMQWEVVAEHGQQIRFLPAWLLSLIQDCLQIDPAKRPSARGIVSTLEKLEDGRGDRHDPTYHVDLVEYEEPETVDIPRDYEEEIPF